MKKVLLSAAALTLLFTDCKKNDDNQPTTQRIVGSWVMTSDQTTISTNGTPGNTTDNFANESTCTKDDLYNFAANGMFSNTEGATKCRTADPDTISKGMYSLYSNDTRLIFKTENGTPVDTFDIVELSGSTMRLKKDITLSGSGITVLSSNQLAFSKK